MGTEKDGVIGTLSCCVIDIIRCDTIGTARYGVIGTVSMSYLVQ